MGSFGIDCNTDSEVDDAIQRAVNGEPDGATVPGGGVEFTWARMRDLENARCWSNTQRYELIQMENLTGQPDENETEPSRSKLAEMVATTVSCIKQVHESLPPCTLLVVYSGTGDPRDLARLQQMHASSDVFGTP